MIESFIEPESQVKSKSLRSNELTYISILLIITIIMPLVWLHGRTIYFWDGVLPFQPLADFHYLNSSWNQLNGLGYSAPVDKFLILIGPYILFSFLGLNFSVVQSTLLTLLLATASLGMFYLVKHLNFLLGKRIHPVFIFIPSLIYIVNYYSVSIYGNFYPGLYAYTILPISALLLILSIENMSHLRRMILYLILFSVSIEFASGTFIFLTPLLIYFLFALISILIVFREKINTRIGKKRKGIFYRYVLSFIFIFVSSNLWWLINFFITLPAQYASSGAGSLSTIYIDFTTFGAFPGKWLSTIALYPQLFPTLYTNGFSWISLYSFKNIVFPILGIIFFAIIILPLLNIRNKKSLLESKSKKRIYALFFFVLYFALQGINPLNRYLYFFLKDTIPFIIPYLYATRLPFTHLYLAFFSVILFYVSIYDLYNAISKRFNDRISESPKGLNSKIKRSINSRGKVVLVILLVLILIVYPGYFYTPSVMQQYDTGHGDVPETVYFPNYFYNLSNYIKLNSNGSDTIVLPLTYSMFSMNFSNGNAFADDSYTGYLFGSPVISGNENYSLFTYINDEIQMPGSNFSAILNNINVKYIILNTIFAPYVHGYPSGTNVTYLKEYLDSQPGLQIVKSFGPLELYRNIFYQGIIQTGSPIYTNSSLYSSQNYMNLNDYFSSINTSYNNHLSKYCNYTSKYNGTISIMFPFSSPGLLGDGFYFSNAEHFRANISQYHYLILEAQTTNGNLLNGTYFAINAETFLSNGSVNSYFIKPEYSSSFYQGNSSFTQYIYPLFGNVLNCTAGSTRIGYYNGTDGAGQLMNKVVIATSWHSNSTFPSYINISRIGLAKSIDPNARIYPGNDISFSNPMVNKYISKSTPDGGAIISYKEISPAKYEVTANDSSGNFTLFLKQNFNSEWIIVGLARSQYYHFIADNYGNGWEINKSGNFTFYLIFSEQTVYNEINFESIFANSILMITIGGILFYNLANKRKIRKNM